MGISKMKYLNKGGNKQYKPPTENTMIIIRRQVGKTAAMWDTIAKMYKAGNQIAIVGIDGTEVIEDIEHEIVEPKKLTNDT
ncbi:MAG TPA: hypothetical protein V6C65_23190 [Allocoleopsis sp.]